MTILVFVRSPIVVASMAARLAMYLVLGLLTPPRVASTPDFPESAAT